MTCGADSRTHGSRRAADRGCRCPEALEKLEVYNTRRRLARESRYFLSDDIDVDTVKRYLECTYQIRLTTAEREAVVGILSARGWSAACIGEYMGITERTVQRYRRRRRQRPGGS